MANTMNDQTRQAIRSRYERAAQRDEACCDTDCCGSTGASSASAVSHDVGYQAEDLAEIPADANLGLGCGNPTAIASLTAGETVLDLGSGAGIDCFLAAGRVGPGGRAIGVDMTPAMIDRARASAAAGGYDNVEFRLGEIESLPVADDSVDVVISNCVLNLSSDRGRALSEAYRVLKRGGRVVISDMVSEQPVPASLREDPDAVAGCLPTPRDAYLRELMDAGFEDVGIERERPYPSSYILDEPGVRRYLADHPEAEAELARFAGSIAGADLVARKPDRPSR